MNLPAFAKKRFVVFVLLLSLPLLLFGCADEGDDYVYDHTFAESLIDAFGFVNDATINTSGADVWPSYDRQNPETYAKEILCGDWEAFAVCETNYDDESGRYYYDSSFCSEDDLPNLSDSIYNGISSLAHAPEYCQQYTASVFGDQTAIIRYDRGRTYTCSYVIEEVQEDYIYCRLYDGQRAIGHFYVYQNIKASVAMRYTLKIVFYTYGGFTSMSVKVGV